MYVVVTPSKTREFRQMCVALNVEKVHTSSLEAAFSQASLLSANVSVSPRTISLHDERNARKNYKVKT